MGTVLSFNGYLVRLRESIVAQLVCWGLLFLPCRSTLLWFLSTILVFLSLKNARPPLLILFIFRMPGLRIINFFPGRFLFIGWRWVELVACTFIRKGTILGLDLSFFEFSSWSEDLGRVSLHDVVWFEFCRPCMCFTFSPVARDSSTWVRRLIDTFWVGLCCRWVWGSKG